MRTLLQRCNNLALNPVSFKSKLKQISWNFMVINHGENEPQYLIFATSCL